MVMLGPRLDLRQSQSLVMTPQLQQSIKLLALSNLEIEAFIGEALESNPLLEIGEARQEAPDSGGESESGSDREAPAAPDSAELMAAGQGEADMPLDLNPGAMDIDRDTGDGAVSGGDWGQAASAGGIGEEGRSLEDREGSGPSLTQHLLDQIGGESYSDQEAFIAAHLVTLLDEAGYLAADLVDIGRSLGVKSDFVEDALILVQSLDPTGVGARSLSECIALQAREANRYDPAMARLIDNLELVAKGDAPRLKRICGVDDEDLADMLRELRSYDPKPGLRFAGSAEAAIVPDILITRASDGGWDIALNEATLPRLVVNRAYYVEMRGGETSKETATWLREKLSDANWLLKAIDQRQKTILKVAAEIIKQQDGFFREGVAGLKPLTLRMVAEAIEMHESTISRVTRNKYLHCERGTFELKYFFTSGVGATEDGEGGASSEAVKARIKALTDSEDPKKILSDDKLVALLKDEGLDLARRTVAKYREAMGIGSSVQRRRAKKMQAL